MVANWDQSIGSYSPDTAGFSREGGRATLSLHFDSVTLWGAIQTILGTVRRKGDGTLNRVAPLAHPDYPWMLAERISNIQGRGAPSKASISAPVEGINPAYGAVYPDYLFTVEFAQMPWAALSDSAIALTTLDATTATEYYDDAVSLTDPQATRYANEWTRYVSFDFLPDVDVMTATHGHRKFRTTGVAPNGYTFPGAPHTYVGRATVAVTWHYVPWGLVLDPNSPIVKYLGRVNQIDWAGFPAGSLLYLAAKIKRYMAPVPDSFVSPGAIAFSHDYCCDITFMFNYTRRDATSPITPASKAWIVNGWNASPWFRDQQFYYVTSTDGTENDNIPSKWVPSHRSFLVQHLFTDPVIL